MGIYQMTDKFKENTSFVLNIAKLASIVIACIAAITFFIYETQGLPPRVSKLETDLDNTKQELTLMKNEIDKSSVKQDIIIDDLKLLKAHLLK